MELIAGVGLSENAIPVNSLRPRLHPGERPAWIDASRWLSHWPVWRHEAENRGLAVDTVVSVALEFATVTAELERLGSRVAQSELAVAANAERPLDRLAPNENLRRWVDVLLAKQMRTCEGDELPELVLPQRLLQMPGWNAALDQSAELEDLDEAIEIEVAAAQRGLTLEGWAFRCTLAAYCRPSASSA